MASSASACWPLQLLHCTWQNVWQNLLLPSVTLDGLCRLLCRDGRRGHSRALPVPNRDWLVASARLALRSWLLLLHAPTPDFLL